MAIERFESWGSPAEDGRAETLADDTAVAAAALAALRAGERLRTSVGQGDLLATLGLDQPRPELERHEYPLDLGVVILSRGSDDPVPTDGWSASPLPDDDSDDDSVAEPGRDVDRLVADSRAQPFVSHVIVGRPVGLGWWCAVMNAPWMNGWRLGPKAHPNDGVVDITFGSLPPLEIPEARRRARSGGHLPHPELHQKRATVWSVEFPRRAAVLVDGVSQGRATGLTVAVIADGLTLVA